MLTHVELKAMPEWQLIAERLGDTFAEHSAKAISEEKDISVVRYHKGWVDAINEFIDMLEQLFPEPHKEEILEDDTLRGETFISLKKDGSVY
jgi:hypothetical protein